MKRSAKSKKETRRKNNVAKGITKGVSKYAMKKTVDVSVDARCSDCVYGLGNSKSVPTFPKPSKCSVFFWKSPVFQGLNGDDIYKITEDGGKDCPEFKAGK